MLQACNFTGQMRFVYDLLLNLQTDRKNITVIKQNWSFSMGRTYEKFLSNDKVKSIFSDIYQSGLSNFRNTPLWSVEFSRTYRFLNRWGIRIIQVWFFRRLFRLFGRFYRASLGLDDWGVLNISRWKFTIYPTDEFPAPCIFTKPSFQQQGTSYPTRSIYFPDKTLSNRPPPPSRSSENSAKAFLCDF